MLAGRFIATARSSASAVRGRRRIAYYYPYGPTSNSHLSNQSTQITASKFSTSRSGFSTKKPANNPSKQQQPDEIPPAGFSFEGLGMTRRTKIAVIIIISIFATMETIFYIRWIWVWYSGTENDETAESKA
ncbi:hypothetical protein F4813DRAFT_342797 [Daldinia decipiens]|uniref:uncharacterized protein n=1 Tax=Daldinia decipiens TaxID=326647 RepID=UPI0020C3D67A|nr:uncharacterized protein F4813DRAFT_342797 [Daldinia decipiens]KAI1663044.1 hypothetical protein F4813DRAFT_342797 [Daldinia decipiens]